MRDFDYRKRYKNLLQTDIVALVAQIHEYKGAQTLFTEKKESALVRLLEIAKIQSIEASNKLEGICVSDERLKKIVRDKTIPRTENEKKIAGYRDVLNIIYENYDYISVKSQELLQMHRDLYKFVGNTGGAFKSENDIISGKNEQENEFCLQSVLEKEISSYMEAVCEAFQEVSSDLQYDPLILIPMFILDFLCISPFSSGTGRMSRLLTLLLLYRAGYMVGMYISIETLIEQTKETYCKTVRESSYNWLEGKNDDAPFVRYMLEMIAAAYQEISFRMSFPVTSGISKPEWVRETIYGFSGKMTRAQIMTKCPDISRVTVERTLTEMVKKGEILKIDGGRYTVYVCNKEKKSDDNR